MRFEFVFGRHVVDTNVIPVGTTELDLKVTPTAAAAAAAANSMKRNNIKFDQSFLALCLARPLRLEKLLLGIGVEMEGGDGGDMVVAQAMTKLHHLQAVTFYDHIPMSSPALLVRTLAQLPSLKEVTFMCVPCCLLVTAALLQQCSSLEEITLLDPYHFLCQRQVNMDEAPFGLDDEIAVEAFCQALAGSTTVRKATLAKFGFDSSDLKRFRRVVEENNHLQQLHLDTYDHEASVLPILEALATNTGLTEVYLQTFKLPVTQAMRVLGILKTSNYTLEVLNLDYDYDPLTPTKVKKEIDFYLKLNQLVGVRRDDPLMDDNNSTGNLPSVTKLVEALANQTDVRIIYHFLEKYPFLIYQNHEFTTTYETYLEHQLENAKETIKTLQDQIIALEEEKNKMQQQSLLVSAASPIPTWTNDPVLLSCCLSILVAVPCVVCAVWN